MRQLISTLVLIPLLFACDKVYESIGDYDTSKNPIVITYNKAKELQTQTKWNDFLIKCNATPDTHYTYFMESTSFIMQAYFKENLPKILSISLSDTNDTNIVIKLLDFYSEWEDLFGCKVNNIELKDINNEMEIYIIRFQQIKIGNTFCQLVYQPFIQFTFTKKMELKSIISTLIPDIELEIPQSSDWVDISKMIDNTMGHEHEFHPDASSIYFPQKHLFSETDTYHSKDGFEIFPEYSGNTFSVYYLKGIEYFWDEDDIEYKCTVYYHPSTTDIIHIKKDD
jgi:hypothetical protein